MTMKKILWSSLVLPVLLAQGVAANSDLQTVIDEAYVQPDYVLGYSLADDQVDQTLKLLSYDDSKDVQVKYLTTDAYSRIMDVDGSSLNLYSSVKIEKLGASKPLTVTILTPENITKVTEDMYRNAALTLGINHAKLSIASPIPVTGESALAGIYYSLEENGASIPQENKELANEELSTLATINDENQGKAGYDADKLNVALTDIKTAIAQLSDKTLTREDVAAIVDEKLAQYQLQDTVSPEHVTLIVNFAFNLSQSSVVDSQDFVANLSTLKDSIISQANASFENLDLEGKTQEAKGFFASIWQQIVDFFTNLFN